MVEPQPPLDILWQYTAVQNAHEVYCIPFRTELRVSPLSGAFMATSRYRVLSRIPQLIASYAHTSVFRRRIVTACWPWLGSENCGIGRTACRYRSGCWNWSASACGSGRRFVILCATSRSLANGTIRATMLSLQLDRSQVGTGSFTGFSLPFGHLVWSRLGLVTCL